MKIFNQLFVSFTLLSAPFSVGCASFTRMTPVDSLLTDKQALSEIDWSDFESSDAYSLEGMITAGDDLPNNETLVKSGGAKVEGRAFAVMIIKKDDTALPYRLVMRSELMDFKACQKTYDDFKKKLGEPSTQQDKVESKLRTLKGQWTIESTGLEILCSAMKDEQDKSYLIYHLEEASAFQALTP